jgi:general secretion pathway protein D
MKGHMKTQRHHRNRFWVLLVSFSLCSAIPALAQQGQQRTGGFAGFGGFAGAQQNRSATTTGNQYNPNGGVGNAIISIDPDSHNITVSADQDTMESIRQVIQNLDKPKPQVLIKVVFIELTHDRASDIGIEGGWRHVFSDTVTGAVASAFGLSGINSAGGSNGPALNVFGMPIQNFAPIPPGAGVYQILGSDFQATLRAIAQAGKAQLLSRPSVLARDNQPATIVVGQSVPLITAVRYDNYGNQINSIQYTDIGIILRVTPIITADGMVQMIVSPETSALSATETVPISQGVSAPVIDKRSADTVVVTPDGQTVVIGGLMRADNAETVNKIPLLGDIPFFGQLFKRTTKANNNVELLIFLTPHIVGAPIQLAAMTDYERGHVLKNLKDQPTTEQELDRFLDQIPAKPTGKKK